MDLNVGDHFTHGRDGPWYSEVEEILSATPPGRIYRSFQTRRLSDGLLDKMRFRNDEMMWLMPKA